MTIQRNESIIHMLKMQIQQLNKEPSVTDSVSYPFIVNAVQLLFNCYWLMFQIQILAQYVIAAFKKFFIFKSIFKKNKSLKFSR